VPILHDSSTVMGGMRVRGVGVVAAGAIAACMLVACGSTEQASLNGVVVTPRPNVASVTLPDVSNGGRSFSTRAEPHGLLVVYFGYTSCPDLCPTTLSDIAVALRKIGADRARRVQVAMATVDPDRDTPHVLTGFLEHFLTTSHALRTTDVKVLAKATEAFGVRYEVAKHLPGDRDYAVGHTALSYVVNDRGLVLVEWPFGIKPPEMASDLKLLLKEEGS
jgi:protein SCO1/2